MTGGATMLASVAACEPFSATPHQREIDMQQAISAM
jgi:hypothetical protein